MYNAASVSLNTPTLLKHTVHVERENVMNRLSIDDRVQILSVLSEGMGVNAACRITGKSKNTVLKLLADVGRACALYQDQAMRNLACKRIECDEIWSFVGAKAKNVKAEHPDGYGDCYTYTAIDPDTKLMPCGLVGVRNRECTADFIADLASRLGNRVQLTTDGWHHYPDAVEEAFHGQVDYVVLNKSYAGGPAVVEARRRYSPPELVTSSKAVVNGNPDLRKASTSIVERSNLSLRMGSRRFTRLTNAFSKKLANHMHAISFYFMVYNFLKVHSSLRVTPAMAAGITNTLWDMKDIVMMSDTMDSKPLARTDPACASR
jgi:IS1 family transposase